MTGKIKNVKKKCNVKKKKKR